MSHRLNSRLDELDLVLPLLEGTTDLQRLVTCIQAVDVVVTGTTSLDLMTQDTAVRLEAAVAATVEDTAEATEVAMAVVATEAVDTAVGTTIGTGMTEVDVVSFFFVLCLAGQREMADAKHITKSTR